MCLRYDIQDLSPPSMVRRDAPLSLKNIHSETWTEQSGLTQYLGRFKITLQRSNGTKVESGRYYIFRNKQTFLEPEQDLKKSATGAHTFYYFDEDFKLIGGATIQDMNNAQYFFQVTSKQGGLKEISEDELKHSSLGSGAGKYDIEFVMVECIDYFKDEYMVINGHHVVRVLRN